MPIPGAPPAGIAGAGSLMSATTDSVVNKVEATLVAFCNALFQRSDMGTECGLGNSQKPRRLCIIKLTGKGEKTFYLCIRHKRSPFVISDFLFSISKIQKTFKIQLDNICRRLAHILANARYRMTTYCDAYLVS